MSSYGIDCVDEVDCQRMLGQEASVVHIGEFPTEVEDEEQIFGRNEKPSLMDSSSFHRMV